MVVKLQTPRQKVLALWSVLWLAYNLQLTSIQILGDSKSIIDGLSGKSFFQPTGFQGWISRVKHLLTRLHDPPLLHIYRELNTQADYLSKRGLVVPFGNISVLHFIDNQQIEMRTFPLP